MWKYRGRGRAALAALLLASAAFSAQVQKSESEGIRLELPVLPGLSRYVDMLEHPAYLALALENNGLSPSLSSRMIVEDSRSLRLRNATLHYKGRQGTVYTYEAGATLDLGVAEPSFSFPVTVDVASVREGKVIVVAIPPLSKLFPTELTDRIQIKARMLTDVRAQQKILEYLDAISMTASGPEGEKLFEMILIDAYNRAGASQALGSGRDRGEAEPLSDQILLLITLAIWLIIVPLAIAGQYLWRKRRQSTRRTAAP